jgi:hypothetical protein
MRINSITAVIICYWIFAMVGLFITKDFQMCFGAAMLVTVFTGIGRFLYELL